MKDIKKEFTAGSSSLSFPKVKFREPLYRKADVASYFPSFEAVAFRFSSDAHRIRGITSILTIDAINFVICQLAESLTLSSDASEADLSLKYRPCQPLKLYFPKTVAITTDPFYNYNGMKIKWSGTSGRTLLLYLRVETRFISSRSIERQIEKCHGLTFYIAFNYLRQMVGRAPKDNRNNGEKNERSPFSN